MGTGSGVGGSTGTTPDTIEQMARDAIAFVANGDSDPMILPRYSCLLAGPLAPAKLPAGAER